MISNSVYRAMFTILTILWGGTVVWTVIYFALIFTSPLHPYETMSMIIHYIGVCAGVIALSSFIYTIILIVVEIIDFINSGWDVVADTNDKSEAEWEVDE